MLNAISIFAMESMLIASFSLRGIEGFISALLSLTIGTIIGINFIHGAILRPDVPRFSAICSTILAALSILLYAFNFDSWSLDTSLGAGIFFSVVATQILFRSSNKRSDDQSDDSLDLLEKFVIR